MNATTKKVITNAENQIATSSFNELARFLKSRKVANRKQYALAASRHLNDLLQVLEAHNPTPLPNCEAVLHHPLNRKPNESTNSSGQKL